MGQVDYTISPLFFCLALVFYAFCFALFPPHPLSLTLPMTLLFIYLCSSVLLFSLYVHVPLF